MLTHPRLLRVSIVAAVSLAVAPLPADVAKSSAALGVGNAVPAATLRDAEGRSFDLRAEVMKHPTVRTVYRGGWCPYCNAHLSALVDIEDSLRATGVWLLAVSPDQPSKLHDTPKCAKRPDYELISDQEATATDSFGISYTLAPELVAKYRNSYHIDLEAASGRTHHKLPHPSVFVVDATGVIQFAHINLDYTTRLAPEEILETARQVSK